MTAYAHHSRTTAAPGLYCDQGGRVTCEKHLGMGDFLTRKFTRAEVEAWLELTTELGNSDPCEDCSVKVLSPPAVFVMEAIGRAGLLQVGSFAALHDHVDANEYLISAIIEFPDLLTCGNHDVHHQFACTDCTELVNELTAEVDAVLRTAPMEVAR